MEQNKIVLKQEHDITIIFFSCAERSSHAVSVQIEYNLAMVIYVYGEYRNLRKSKKTYLGNK